MKKAVNYLYCMAVIMASGNPALRLLNVNALTIVLFLIGAVIFLRRSKFVSPRGALTVVAVGFLLLIQVTIFGDLVFAASVGFFLNILIAFMLMSCMPNFLQYFVRCMFVISIVSIAMYFLVLLPGNYEFFKQFAFYEETERLQEFHIGFYNFRNYYNEARNSGPFWEPGAYAGYLAIALFIVILQSAYRKQSIIIVVTLVVALLTTLSTMGYVAFLLVIFAYLVQRFRGTNLIMLLVAFPLVMGGTIYGALHVAESVPFLKEKIVDQFDDADEGKEKAEINRIGNMEYDLTFVSIRPFFGWSANVDTRVSIDPNAQESVQAQGNALTGIAARFGIVGWLLFMTSFLLSFYRGSGSLIIGGLGLALIAVTFTGEKYMNYPLIMTLLFLERHHIFTRELVAKRRKSSRDKTLGARLRWGKRIIASPFSK